MISNSMEEKMDDFTLDLPKLFLGPTFARGGNSQLYRGTYKDEQVAVKIIQVPQVVDDEDDSDDGRRKLADRLWEQFKKEATFLSRLRHKNVIKLVAAYEKPPVLAIVTEYLSGGSLRLYLNQLGKKFLPLPKLVDMALDIARGMEYIHSQGIVHMDLKPENILIDEEFRLKVADFGISCEEASCNLVKERAGTFRWMAPEVIKSKSCDRKVDAYAFGLMLWTFVAGDIPFKGMAAAQVYVAVAYKDQRPIIPGHCPPAMRFLIQQCWSPEPKKRPEFWQIVKVLEQFQTRLARQETLNMVIDFPSCQDHERWGPHWLKIIPKPILGYIFG